MTQLKKKGISISSTTGKKPEHIMRGERGPSQKSILHKSTYMRYLEKSNS